MTAPDDDNGVAPGTALSTSFASDGMDAIVGASDAGLDALISSGALDGVPIFGLLHGIYKVSRHVPALLYQRKVARMLQAVADNSTRDERRSFADRAARAGEAERLGETILLMLDKADELEKPALIGRLTAAHIRGDLTRDDWLRLCSMINRTYYPDLQRLRTFRYGTGAPNQTVYATLAAVGFLGNSGHDGGLWGSNDPMTMGGDLHHLNELGGRLLQFGFGMEVDLAAEVRAAETSRSDARQEALERH